MDSSTNTPSSAISPSEPTSRLMPPPVGDTPKPTVSPSGTHRTGDGPVTGAVLVVDRGPRQGERFEITADQVSLGRHPECDIVLDDSTVSRRHAEVRHEHGEFVIVDTGSLNGTYVNRQPVDRANLADGHAIWIGKFRFSFHLVRAD